MAWSERDFPQELFYKLGVPKRGVRLETIPRRFE